jgi:uncharacterized linocin/CFP29 family protein
MNDTDLGWSDEAWKEIDDDVLKEVGKVRIAQRVFPTSALENDPTQIWNEVIDFSDLTIKEGDTKPLVEIYREFSLTATQVKQENEHNGHNVGRTLARMGAKEIALAEDAYIFQISDRAAKRGVGGVVPVLSNKEMHADNWRFDIDFGLLAEANNPNADDADPSKPSKPIQVSKVAAAVAAIAGAKAGAPPPAPSPLYGEETFKAVTNGIAKLVSKAQAPTYALFLPTGIYADTFIPPSSASLVTTADRIKPLVEGGFYTSGVLPADEGLLAALGGEPVKLFVGREANAEYIRKEGAKYFFRVVERVQYVVRDPRALVLLKFV